jgi:predicted transcriptional regulator
MNLTDFGRAVRKARIDVGVTLQDMAASLSVSPAFLSSLEVGRKRIPEEWVKKIQKFFKEKGAAIPNLQVLADISNKTISLDEMNPQKAMLLAGFARTALTKEQLKKLSELLETGGDR